MFAWPNCKIWCTERKWISHSQQQQQQQNGLIWCRNVLQNNNNRVQWMIKLQSREQQRSQMGWFDAYLTFATLFLNTCVAISSPPAVLWFSQQMPCKDDPSYDKTWSWGSLAGPNYKKAPWLFACWNGTLMPSETDIAPTAIIGLDWDWVWECVVVSSPIQTECRLEGVIINMH